MSFSSRRYDQQVSGGPIFRIQPALFPNPMADVQIILNIGPLGLLWVYDPHLAFQKKTCPLDPFDAVQLNDKLFIRQFLETERAIYANHKSPVVFRYKILKRRL